MTDDRSANPAFPGERHVLEPGCSRCPDLVACRTRIAWGNGPADADVLVVGEAPGAGDPDADRWRGGNLTGLAYTSRHSSRRIRRLMADRGYADRTYYTKWYFNDFSRDQINVRWIDENKCHCEYRMGEKYEDELREYFSD